MKTQRLGFSLVLICLIIMISDVFGQGGYEVYFKTGFHENIKHVFKQDDDSFIVVLATLKTSNKYIPEEKVYSFSNDNESDTLKWQLNLLRQDTTLAIACLIRDKDLNYIITGYGKHYNEYDSIISSFNWIMKLDVDRNLIWEKMYNRPENAKELDRTGWFELLDMGSSGYLYGGRIHGYTPSPVAKIYLMHFNTEGDTVKTKLFSQYLSGYSQALAYNHDSSAILLHKSGQPIPGCVFNDGALLLDTVTFDTTGLGMCYEEEESIGWINQPYDAQLLKTGELIVAGRGYRFLDEFYLNIYKFDSSYNIIRSAYLTNPDTSMNPGWAENLDINQNGEICVTGSFDNALGQFPSYYCWAYVAKLDSDLNLIRERYFGGDASYDVYGIAATGDGGIAIGGYRYDYLTNGENEGDAFIIKTDKDLWVGNHENIKIPIHSAIVYPNPGTDLLNIRTTLKQAVFKLYGIHGHLILERDINQLITTINSANLPTGPYFWTISQNKSVVDKGKWLKP